MNCAPGILAVIGQTPAKVIEQLWVEGPRVRVKERCEALETLVRGGGLLDHLQTNHGAG